MISIEKLMQNLTQCKDTNITLPSMNDNDDSKFVQKTAILIRRDELSALDTVISQLNEANYTMDKELVDLGVNTIDKNDNVRDRDNFRDKDRNKLVNQETIVPSKSLIVYTENETAPLPEIILNIFTLSKINSDEWYIYGVKNPESFYKSFMLLTKMDFIIKNKNEKKNEVATFKREMAMQYETFYKSLNYRKMRFPHYEMVHNLTSVDNYAEYDALKYIVDYSMTNLIILDIIGKKYLDIKYTSHTLLGNCTNTSIELPEYVVIIKYANNTYLPLMSSTSNHKFNTKLLETISNDFERITLDKFKENITGNSSSFDTQNNDDERNERNECNNSNDSNDNTLPLASRSGIDNVDCADCIDEVNGMDDVGDILNCDTISVFYNNTISSNIEQLSNKYDPIIKAGSISFAIEDIIDIEEQEDTPIGSITTTTTTTTDVKNIAINVPKNNSVVVNHLDSSNSNSNSNSEPDAFSELMSKIPMKGKAKTIIQKTTKTSKTIETNKPIEKKQNTLETLLSTVANNTIANADANANANANTKDKKVNSSVEEELKPVGKYTLLDLQMLAKLYKIDTQKQGSAGKKINKTKGEMYEEIQDKIQK
jgi:hypothetical protein